MPVRQISYLMYMEKFTVVPQDMLCMPFLCMPTKFLITWHLLLFSWNASPVIIKSSICILESFVSIINLLVFNSLSVQTAGLLSLEISNLPSVLPFFLCGICAKTSSLGISLSQRINFCNSNKYSYYIIIFSFSWIALFW